MSQAKLHTDEHGRRAEMTQELRISCDTCEHAGSAHCADCVVSFLCGAPQSDAVVFDISEARAVRMLARAGLVPECAHVPCSA